MPPFQLSVSLNRMKLKVLFHVSFTSHPKLFRIFLVPSPAKLTPVSATCLPNIPGLLSVTCLPLTPSHSVQDLDSKFKAKSLPPNHNMSCNLFFMSPFFIRIPLPLPAKLESQPQVDLANYPPMHFHLFHAH